MKGVSLSLTDTSMRSHIRDADGLLGSPDLELLERLITQSNGMVTKTATDEQEFAEGFVKALEDLHKRNQSASSSLDPGANIHIATQLDRPVYTNLNAYAGGPLEVDYPTDTLPLPPPSQHFGVEPELARLQQPKEEPQTVPDVQSFGESPPLSPVDMDSQERIKADRKRLRNRIAASKCRRRKLERICRLEDKVKTLKNQNTDLACTASVLREQVALLKEKVLTHLNRGCQLLTHEVRVH